MQVHISTSLPSLTIVGLASKLVPESKERERATLSNMGLALPPKRISVNLSSAGMIKEGTHFDLPIALAIVIAMGALSQEYLDKTIILGELLLDGSILSVFGILPLNYPFAKLSEPEKQKSDMADIKRSQNSKARFGNSHGWRS